MVHCWARYLFLLMLVGLGLGEMLAACGQKGPLYLAEEPAAGATQAAPAPAAAPRPLPDDDGEGLEALEDVPEVSPSPDISGPSPN